MSLLENPVVLGSACFLGGSAIGYWLWRWKERNLRAVFTLKEQSALDDARRQAEVIGREARVQANEEAIKIRQAAEHAYSAHKQELTETEKRLVERESLINHQLQSIVEEERRLREQQDACQRKSDGIEHQRQELAEAARRRREELQAICKLNEAEARAQVLKEVEMESLQDASQLTRRILEEARTRAEEKARHIISLAIQRYAGQHTNEISSTTIALPGEDLKGRIIGREGRNIRAFETATGVTVLIDDTPNAVVLSGFDPVRREIARESMQRLILDGRIHPTRIEEVVAKVSQEMDESIVRYGEEAVLKAGAGPIHPDIIKTLGRLRFRHSFSQNVLDIASRSRTSPDCSPPNLVWTPARPNAAVCCTTSARPSLTKSRARTRWSARTSCAAMASRMWSIFMLYGHPIESGSRVICWMRAYKPIFTIPCPITGSRCSPIASPTRICP